jgi:hypothetical protein
LQSKVPAFTAPRRCWISEEQAGTIWSGLTVPTTIKSRSFGSSLADSRAARPAWTARSDVACSSETKRRSRIPVRWTIHSSEVSTIFSK